MARLILLISTLLGALLFAQPALSADYPSRQVRIVVPFPPGGLVDQLARLLAQQLSEQTHQSFIVDNRAGASGIIGSSNVSKAAPDGYTLLVQTTGFVITPLILPSIPYDIKKDFTPVSYLGDVPMLVVAHPSLPVKNLKDFTQLLRANPGKYAMGAPIIGALGHLAEEAIKFDSKLDYVIAPYKGTSPMINDVAGNQIAAGIEAMPALLPLVQDGKLKPLAVTSAKRVALFPDLPTVSESGFPGFDMVSWFGLWAPPGLPADVLQRLSAEVVKAVASPQFSQRLANQGYQANSSTPAELAAHVSTEMEKYKDIVKNANIKLD